VFGDVIVGGMNAKLLGLRVGGTLSISGKHAECADSFAFSDVDGDGVLAELELGAPLACE
jgi:hypothetical protein